MLMLMLMLIPILVLILILILILILYTYTYTYPLEARPGSPPSPPIPVVLHVDPSLVTANTPTLVTISVEDRTSFDAYDWVCKV